MFQSQSKDAYDLLAYCNVSHIKLSSNIIHYFLKTKYSFIYYSTGKNRNNWILDINSMRNMNMGIPHLHSLHLANNGQTEIHFYYIYFPCCIVCDTS